MNAMKAIKGILKAIWTSFLAGLSAHPTTTVFGLLIAAFTGLSQIEQLKDYAGIFACLGGLCSALLGACTTDAKRE